ncbi:helix-turn-helix domain-containing protein [Kaistia dalseonensis]|uniref:AraC-like DNA-binding protein n=1 Tax=Kaistia dalseonensis TaxID=410840 RepID=A0ABU0H0Y5_9HYPH|nr:helix-turn-helix domain-containing protein [Kaistia dalseonensis]MCX5493402.1 helix-turn-helix domain-containing protein [Kaistia dalseonensis]MDQ0435960.1 AraC-like DNA-binding protein [Kaistia dalseonensis]
MTADAARPLNPIRFNSSAIPKHDQFDAWRTFVGGAADISLVSAPESGFAADLTIWDLQSMAFMRAELPGQGYLRRYQNRQKDPVDHWCLLLTGRSESTAGGAGSWTLRMRPLGLPFDHVSEDPEMLLLYVCRDLFPGLEQALDSLPADVPDSGLARIVADYMQILARNLPRVTAAERGAVTEATRVLLAALAASNPDALAEAERTIDMTLRARIRRYIRQNLGAPDLSPDGLCRAVGISRSRLYRLFEDLGGVAAYIQRQRLLAALAALSEPDPTRTVSSVAQALAFRDLSSFSRSFKNVFGFSPSDARQAGAAGRPLLPWTMGALEREPDDFDMLLRRLQV